MPDEVLTAELLLCALGSVSAAPLFRVTIGIDLLSLFVVGTGMEVLDLVGLADPSIFSLFGAPGALHGSGLWNDQQSVESLKGVTWYIP
jgi:hypothetical protein